MEESNNARFIPFDLIQKQLEGVISEQERILLGCWIAEDLENEKCYDEIIAVSADLSVLEHYKNVDVNHQWDRFNPKLDEVEDAWAEQQPSVRRLRQPWTIFTAAAVLLLIGTTCYLNFGRWMGYEVRLYGTAAKEPFLLPDSSVMILDPGSEAIFNKNTFLQQRTVKLLSGKALFDVRHLNTNSFVVQLENNYVRDIGTSFEIDLRSGDVEVLVTSGTVALSDAKGHKAKELILYKNEKGLFKKKTAMLSKIVVEASDAGGLAQKISYTNERLENICNDLSRRFQINVLVVGDSLKERKVTVYFEGQSLHEIVQILSKTLNLKWKSTKIGYSIYQ